MRSGWNGLRFGLRYHSRMQGSLHIFSGKIYKVGLIRYVDVPKEVTRQIAAAETYVPVQGTVEGIPLRTTLVARGSGRHRVAIHGDIHKKLRLEAGAVVEIAIERDEDPREPVLPPFLVMSLRNAPRAQAVFRSMSTALRRQVVRYLTAVKLQATLERRVAKFIRRLEDDARRNPPKRRRAPKKQ